MAGVLTASPGEAGRRRRPPNPFSVSFGVSLCPSYHAPLSCVGAATAVTCHDAFVEGGPGAGCSNKRGKASEYLLPEDGPDDGGVSRAWSFAIRPIGRSFGKLVYPELTGSVRVMSDGLGMVGSRTGAADQAHVRLASGGASSVVLVLRWFTGGLPSASEARLRVATAGSVLFETHELAGPPVRRTEVLPVDWSGNLDLTISAVVTAPRDVTTPSSDLLWHLAVLMPRDDTDHDGYRNAFDPDPLDRDTPNPRGPSGRPTVLVIGLDGVGWDVLDALMDGGFLPTLGALVDAGIRAPLDETPVHPSFCCFCPPVWSSLATGRPQFDHHMNLYESEPWDRGVPAVWTALAKLGGTTTHVTYRNTFPPEPGSTYNVTEVGASYAAEFVHDPWNDLSERGEQMNRLQLTWPPLLFEQLGILPAAGERLPALTIFAQDRVSRDAIVGLAAARQTDLTLWTLHAPDKTEHINWGSIQTEHGVPIDTAVLLNQAAQWDGPVFGPPYNWGTVGGQQMEADAQVAQLLAVASYDYVILTSDHAMTLSPDYPVGLSGHHITPPAFHGIFALSGPGVAPGMTLPPVSLLDVAPTVAYLLGIPVAENLPGRVISEAFTAEHLAAYPIETTPRW